MRVYHILSHTLESFYPDKLETIDGYSHVDHTINRFVSSIIQYGDSDIEHIVVLPTKTHPTQSKPIKHKDGYCVYIIHTYSLGFPFEFSWDMIRFIRNIGKEDIIHIYGTGSFLFDSIAPFLLGKKSIAHYMGGHFTWKFFPFSFIKYFLLQPITLRFPKILFIQNSYRIQKYKEIYKLSESKMRFVPVAIKPDDFFAKKYNSDSPGVIRFLFVGRLEVAKGIYELLESYASLKKKYQNIELSIAGTGSLKEFVEDQEKNIGFKYIGSIDQPLLSKVYQSHDVFVLPTHFDCFPSVLVEAGMSGLPSISTEVEGPLSIIQDGRTGYIVRPKNSQELEDMMEYYILHPEDIRKMGLEAARHIRENFTWEQVIQSYMTTYHRL